MLFLAARLYEQSWSDIIATMSEDILIEAIHREIAARDLYRSLCERIGDPRAKQRMLDLSTEEEVHRGILAARFEKVQGKSFDRDSSRPADPALEFVQRSTFRHTDALVHRIINSTSFSGSL